MQKSVSPTHATSAVRGKNRGSPTRVAALQLNRDLDLNASNSPRSPKQEVVMEWKKKMGIERVMEEQKKERIKAKISQKKEKLSAEEQKKQKLKALAEEHQKKMEEFKRK